MTDINLLPWRELRREKEKKKFMTLLLMASLLAVAIVLLLYTYQMSILDSQMARNQRLQEAITRYDRQIADIKALKQVRNELISRMKIVYGLQAKRTLTVHLFDELIKILPDGVYLTELKRKDDLVTLRGYVESNTNVSLLMRNIQNNPWIQNPILTEIRKPDVVASPPAEQSSKTGKSEFVLSFSLIPKALRHDGL